MARSFHASSFLRQTTIDKENQDSSPKNDDGFHQNNNSKTHDFSSHWSDVILLSRNFLDEKMLDDMESIDRLRNLLQEWLRVTTTERQNICHHHEKARTIFQDLYTYWAKQTSFPQVESSSSTFKDRADTVLPSSSFSEAQAPLLPLWLQIFANLGMGSKALQVLQGWTLCFGSHLELQPRLYDYETVLRAYATAISVQQYREENATSTDGVPESASVSHRFDSHVEGAEVAMEILSLLHELSFTMTPVGSTYLWALQCLAAAPPADGSFEKVLHQSEVVLFDKKGRRKQKIAPPALWLDSLTSIYSSVYNTPLDRPTLTPWLQAWSDWVGDKESLALINQHPELFFQVRQGVRHVMAIYSTLNCDEIARQTSDDMLRLVKACEGFQNGMTSSSFKPSHTLISSTLYVMSLEAVLNTPIDKKTEQVAQELLDSLVVHHDKHVYDLPPQGTRESFLALLKAYYLIGAYHESARLFRRMSAEMVQWDTDILELFLETAMASQDRNLCAVAWKVLRKTIYAKRARLAVLESRHFETILDAFIHCRHNKGAEIGLKILDALEQVAAEEGSSVEVTASHFSKVSTLMSYSPVPGVAEEIVKLMNLMANRYNLEPDDEMFGSLVIALGRSSSEVAAKKAEDLLQSLAERNSADVRAYVAVMYAWMNSGHRDWIQHVEDTFARLLESSNHDLKPHKVAFRAMLEAWGKAGREKDAKRAVELLEDFEKRAAGGLVLDEAGDVKLYTAAMRVVWRSKVLDAHKIVSDMYDRLSNAAAQRPDDLELQPDSTAMTVVMQSWAGSVEQNKATFVWGKWQHLVDQYRNGNLRMKPSSHTAAAVLHACLFTPENKGTKVRLEAVDVALNLWPEIEELNLVNDHLIVQLLKVLGRHVDEYGERARLSTIVFQHACVNGCVSSAVTGALKTYAPTIFKQLPKNASNNIDLPPQWTRSVTS
jgi:hypothetical protein